MDETRTDVIAGIVASMRDPSWTVRVEALRSAAATLGTGTVEEADELRFAPLLVEAARDPKWEVRKEAAIALAECRHQNGIPDVLATLERDENRWVSQAAERAGKRMRARASRAEQWQLSPDAHDPTLQYITQRIRAIGLRSMTPAHIYELAMEISEQSYRDLAADTAHELNTLLTPFEGYLVALRRRLDGRRADATLNSYLDKALGRLQQIQLLTDTLSTYSLPTEADFAPVDVAAVVRDAVAIGHDRATSRDDGERPAITHAISVPAGLVVDALRDRLLRAIANLVANACQAMPDGGTLTVRARGEIDTLTIEITDTGRGMNPEQIEKARLRFGTTRRDEGGTGLGIPIAERIVKEDHGGDLLIESAPSIGTTVTLILPVRRSIDQ